MIEIKFQYDEQARKWDPLVVGTSDPNEAREAFAAVVKTCQLLDPQLLQHTRVTEDFHIQPAMTTAELAALANLPEEWVKLVVRQ